MVIKRIIVFIAGFLCIIVIGFLGFVLNFAANTKDYKNCFNSGSVGIHNGITGNNHDPDISADLQQGYKFEEGQLLLSTGSNEPDANKTINILFLGIDKSEEREKALKVYRTDTIIVAAINLDTKSVQVLSIPRDTYVYIPCINRMDKINHAYPFGGMNDSGVKSTIDTVNEFIKYTRVDYYFTLDMEPIPQIVDELGGVEIDVEVDMKTHGANLAKGKQLLDGHKAFDYIHWRYSANGDIDRIKRQQKLLKALFKKLKDSDNTVSAANLVLNYDKHIKTNMSFKQLISLAALSNELRSADMYYLTIPGTPKNINGNAFWIADEHKTDEILKRFSNTSKTNLQVNFSQK